MAAWGENQVTLHLQGAIEGLSSANRNFFQNAGGKVRMLADTTGALAKALDLELDLAAVLGSVRCKRFSLVIEDGKVKEANVEPDGTGLTCSLADKINA